MIIQRMPKAATPGEGSEASRILQETWSSSMAKSLGQNGADSSDGLDRARDKIKSAKRKESAAPSTKDPIEAVLKLSEWDLAKWAGNLSGPNASKKMAVPICLAAALGWDDGVKVLLAAGAEWWDHGAPMKKNSYSNAPALTWSWRSYEVPGLSFSSTEKIKSVQKNALYTALAYAAMNGRSSCVKILVDHRRRHLPLPSRESRPPLPRACLISNISESPQAGAASFAIEKMDDELAKVLIKGGAGSENLQEELCAAAERQSVSLAKQFLAEMTPEMMSSWQEVDRRGRTPRELLNFLVLAQQSSLIARVVELGADAGLPAWKEPMRGEALIDAIEHCADGNKCARELARGTRFYDKSFYESFWSLCADPVTRDILDARHPVWATLREEDSARRAQGGRGDPAREQSQEAEEGPAEKSEEEPVAASSLQERRERALKDLDAFELLIQEMSAAARRMRADLEGQGLGGPEPAKASHGLLDRALETLSKSRPEPPRRAAAPSGAGKDVPQGRRHL